MSKMDGAEVGIPAAEKPDFGSKYKDDLTPATKPFIIDSDNYAAAGIETMLFPDGQPHAKLPDLTHHERVVFIQRLRCWEDVGHAACVNDALGDQFRARDFQDYSSICLYLPGARQDKANPIGSAPVSARLIERLLHPESAFDIHNPAAYDKPTFVYVDGQEQSGFSNICSLTNIMPSHLGLPLRPEVDFVIAPDKGAVNRARDFMNAYCPNATLICATKERDPASGKLSHYQLPVTEEGKTYLVVDDICDGGGTFNLLAQAFWEGKVRKAGTRLELFVSHGIFSKGLARLFVDYQAIYTTDSFYVPDPRDELWFDLVTVYELNNYIGKMLEVLDAV